MGVSSANCGSGFPLPLSFPEPTGSVSWEAFHPLSLAVRALRGCSIAATRPPFFPMGVSVHALFAPEALAVPGFYADFGSVDSALRNAFPISEFSLDLESRFADFRVLGPSRWLPVDGESVRTRFPPGSIVSWRLCALVLCFCLCPPKFCASRFGKSRSMEKEFPSCFLFGFSGSSAASLPALRQRRRSFRYACVVQL